VVGAERRGDAPMFPPFYSRHTLEIKMDNRCRIGAVAGALCRYQIGNCR
jgi:hypothetical protein